MKLAELSDRARVIEIFQESYLENPHVRFLIGNRLLNNRLERLANFVFDVGIKRNGVYLSDDLEGVVVMFPLNLLTLSFTEKITQLFMALGTFELTRMLKILRIESRIKKSRRGNPEDLYVWFYGVSRNGAHSDTARQLMKSMFNISTDKQVKLIAETSLSRNKLIYERFGFETYGYQQYSFPVYFMHRNPSTLDAGS